MKIIRFEIAAAAKKLTPNEAGHEPFM